MKKIKTAIVLGLLVALGTFTEGYAQMSAHLDNTVRKPISIPRVGRTDREALRVIFLAGSDYSNFRIGIENVSKSPVTIEVLNEDGAIVFSKHKKKVYKQINEMDFSFLKRGEYVVRVFNDNNEFSQVLRVP